MTLITCPHCRDTYPDFDVAHVCSKGLYAPKLKPKMNERIRQLALQAGPNIVKEFDQEDIDFCEKFAELIVRECAEVGSKFSQAHPLDIQYQIKRHFGVEE